MRGIVPESASTSGATIWVAPAFSAPGIPGGVVRPFPPSTTSRVENPLAAALEATLKPLNQGLLPVTFLFDRASCPGSQVAELPIPNEVLSGNALLFC